MSDPLLRPAMTESKVDVMRRQFEAEMRKVGYLFTRDGDDYLETSMQFAWVGFQAALQSPVIGELVDASNELLTDMKIAQVNMRNAARHEPRWEGCAEAIQPRVDRAKAALAACTPAKGEGR